MKCTSCGTSVDTDKVWVEFDCPSCGKEKITRCSRCKSQVNKYKCKACGLIGP